MAFEQIDAIETRMIEEFVKLHRFFINDYQAHPSAMNPSSKATMQYMRDHQSRLYCTEDTTDDDLKTILSSSTMAVIEDWIKIFTKLDDFIQPNYGIWKRWRVHYPLCMIAFLEYKFFIPIAPCVPPQPNVIPQPNVVRSLVDYVEEAAKEAPTQTLQLFDDHLMEPTFNRDYFEDPSFALAPGRDDFDEYQGRHGRRRGGPGIARTHPRPMRGGPSGFRGTRHSGLFYNRTNPHHESLP